MITRFKGINNSQVSVVFSQFPEAVGIHDAITGKGVALYAGIPQLKELYNAFVDSFSDNITVDDAVQFFKVEFKIN